MRSPGGSERTNSRMRDSIGPVTIDHLSCLALTTGSTDKTIFGICVKPNQSRLLGGRFILTSSVPSSSLRTTARTSRTVYGLKRDPSETVASVSIVTRASPT